MEDEKLNTIKLKLKSSDGQPFEIKEKSFIRSYYYNQLKDILNPNEEMPLNGVDSKNLSKMIEFLNHYENENPKVIPKPLPGPDLKPILDEWDYNYIITPSLKEIVDLINAANVLGINEIISLCSARLASEMINCSIEEARQKFGIVPDMTQEEMEEMDQYPLD